MKRIMKNSNKPAPGRTAGLMLVVLSVVLFFSAVPAEAGSRAAVYAGNTAAAGAGRTTAVAAGSIIAEPDQNMAAARAGSRAPVEGGGSELKLPEINLPKIDFSKIDKEAEKEKLREALKELDEKGLSPEKIAQKLWEVVSSRENQEKIGQAAEKVREKVTGKPPEKEAEESEEKAGEAGEASSGIEKTITDRASEEIGKTGTDRTSGEIEKTATDRSQEIEKTITDRASEEIGKVVDRAADQAADRAKKAVSEEIDKAVDGIRGGTQ